MAAEVPGVHPVPEDGRERLADGAFPLPRTDPAHVLFVEHPVPEPDLSVEGGCAGRTLQGDVQGTRTHYINDIKTSLEYASNTI